MIEHTYDPFDSPGSLITYIDVLLNKALDKPIPAPPDEILVWVGATVAKNVPKKRLREVVQFLTYMYIRSHTQRLSEQPDVMEGAVRELLDQEDAQSNDSR